VITGALPSCSCSHRVPCLGKGRTMNLVDVKEAPLPGERGGNNVEDKNSGGDSLQGNC